MLFDLRSRGRRRTVQGVYLALALLMGLGLVLFGVGAGNGIGGLLNAFTGNGSGNSQNQAISQQERSALNAVRNHPNSAGAWGSLLQARWSAAGNEYNTTTATFTAAGKQELAKATQDWQRYLQLTKSPDPALANLAAEAYGKLGDYAGEADAWQVETSATPSDVHGFECLAAAAFAAGQTDRANLALTKALTMVPKAQRTTLKTEISAAKTQHSVAQQC
jgi:tetratricopeptide (TPR) repeat protein